MQREKTSLMLPWWCCSGKGLTKEASYGRCTTNLFFNELCSRVVRNNGGDNSASFARNHIMFTVFVSSLPFELSPVMVNWRYNRNLSEWKPKKKKLEQTNSTYSFEHCFLNCSNFSSLNVVVKLFLFSFLRWLIASNVLHREENGIFDPTRYFVSR